MDCKRITSANKKCFICDKKAAVIKQARGYRYDIGFDGQTKTITIK